MILMKAGASNPAHLIQYYTGPTMASPALSALGVLSMMYSSTAEPSCAFGVNNIRVEQRVAVADEPLFVDTQSPRFSWALSANGPRALEIGCPW